MQCQGTLQSEGYCRPDGAWRGWRTVGPRAYALRLLTVAALRLESLAVSCMRFRALVYRSAALQASILKSGGWHICLRRRNPIHWPVVFTRHRTGCALLQWRGGPPGVAAGVF